MSSHIKFLDRIKRIYPFLLITLVIVAISGCMKVDQVRINKVATGSITAITFSSCTAQGIILDQALEGIDYHGFYYAKHENPTSGEFQKTDLGKAATPGNFSQIITDLDPGTTYYIVAYLGNEKGEVYGETATFSTAQLILPTVSTREISNITQDAADGGGNVTHDGGSAVTARGVCWSTLANPDISVEKTEDGSGLGEFPSTLTGLTCGTVYYVRAYATNSAGTAYGNQVTFTTTTCATLPVVTTYQITDIGIDDAKGGGSITSDGGSTITVRGICWSTSPGPTLSDSRTTDGNGSGSFESIMTGLGEFTTYYVRAYATNSAGTGYGNQVSFTSTSVTDYDENMYRIVQIGDQIWMAENLLTTHYEDGTQIPLVENQTAWDDLSITAKAFCWPENNAAYGNTYGALYTWAAAMYGEGSSNLVPSGVQGVCPSGWHLPSDDEWKELLVELGMPPAVAETSGWIGTDEGGKLKESGTEHWNAPNIASNESGFTALPAGTRDPNGVFFSLGIDAIFWTSTEHQTSYSRNYKLTNNSDLINRNYYRQESGFSVRCIQDE